MPSLKDKLRGLLGPSQRSTEEELMFEVDGRWLYNERAQRDIRHVRFDPHELARVASEAANAGACTEFEKLAEGSYNKVFRLTFANSSKVIARIPTPLAGPSHLVTASEVATMEFARDVLKLPVPRVLTWSGAQRSPNPSNGVGADFIIMEEVPGTSILDRWEHLDTPNLVMPFLKGVLELEKTLDSVRFAQIGSLYFKEDVSEHLQSQPVLVGEVDQATLTMVGKYRIGPLLDRQLWRGERATMDLDRGPWPDALSFFNAVIKNEEKVIAESDPSIIQYRRKPMEDKTTHLKLLSMLTNAMPHLIPSNTPDVCAPALWHPDLSRSNIHVSATGPASLTGVIDWQHTSILPYFTLPLLPQCVVYDGGMVDISVSAALGLPPSLPPDFDSLTPEAQTICRFQLKEANRHMWYYYTSKKNIKTRSDVESLPHPADLGQLSLRISRTWGDGSVPLRETLIRIRDRWDNIAPDTPCPIQFSEAELEEHERLGKIYDRSQAFINDFQSRFPCQGDGWVREEDFDQAREGLTESQSTWNEEIVGVPAPYKDGEHSFFLS